MGSTSRVESNSHHRFIVAVDTIVTAKKTIDGGLLMFKQILALAFGTLLAAPMGLAAQTPTLWIIGDSTVRNNTKGQQGWGDPLKGLFDSTKIKVENRALGGRSSRTFHTEGLWAKIVANMKEGDFVLMQFGHNDGGPLDSGRARASLRGTGEDTFEIVDLKGKKETVHTYGWYMRKYCTDAKAKGATPIVLSPIPRNIWMAGKVARASRDYGKWSMETAKTESVPFVDLNEIIAVHYEKLGKEKVDPLFFGDHTHTSPPGAKLNAECVVEGLRGLKDCSLCKYLK
jgi:lysophospholipase L1-like esterase